jgi:hypothetical protein
LEPNPACADLGDAVTRVGVPEKPRSKSSWRWPRTESKARRLPGASRFCLVALLARRQFAAAGAPRVRHRGHLNATEFFADPITYDQHVVGK